jgi:hypothetical protein
MIHSNVNGAGTIGEYDTLGQDKEEAGRLGQQAKDIHDTHGYRCHVFDRRADERHTTQ